MTRPKLEEIIGYYTTGMLAREFGISRKRIKSRIDRGLFPPPTLINKHGIRLFDIEWVERTTAILDCENGLITPMELQERFERIGEKYSVHQEV